MSTSVPGGSSNSNPSPSSTNPDSPSFAISLRATFREAVLVGAEDILVSSVSHKAEDCRPGDVFVPLHTSNRDEHDRAEEAIKRGAVAIVAERLLPVSVPQCLVEDTQQAFGLLSQKLAGDPSKRMLTIAVVGTSAKTTTSLFLSSMLKSLGGAVAYSTSLGESDSKDCNRKGKHPGSAKHLAEWLKKADLQGSPAAVIEMTTSMLQNQIAAGVEFDLVVLTSMRPGQQRNAPSVRNYGYQLDRLMGKLKSHGMLLYNADDSQAALWVQRTGLAAISYGLDVAEHVRGKRLDRSGAQQKVLVAAGNVLMPLTLQIPGDHVARAALAAVAAAWMFDFSVPDAIAGIEKLQKIPGRLQRIPQSVEVPIFIDSAWTPDQLAIATHALRQHQLGPATVVMDVGNALDPKWRQRLGEVLDKGCTQVVLTGTSMTPEAVQTVAMDVLGGLKAPGRANIIPDREAAINWAVDRTEKGCILLAGVGQQVWPGREGEPLSDEIVAVGAVSSKNAKCSAPALAIFPPSDPDAFFPIDS